MSNYLGLRDREGCVVTGLTPWGVPAMGLYRGAPSTEKIIDVDVNGVINTNVAPGPVGGNIVTDADVAVGVGLTVALGAPPATTRAMTIQNTGLAGGFVRIRATGGVAVSGALLAYLSARTYDDAAETCEAENVGAVASTVGVQYETA